MINYYGVVRESAQKVAAAAKGTIETLIDGRIEQEPAFTDPMLGRIEQAMNDYEVKGIRWSAKTLTDRAPGAQEKRFGADFVGVLQISFPSYHVDKGFLAQSKLIERDEMMANEELHRMKDQCEKMLSLSPDSFVFLYSRVDIRVVPALTVVSGDHRNPYDYYSRGVESFFEGHFECFFGDRGISAPNIETLEELLERTESRSLLYLGATFA